MKEAVGTIPASLIYEMVEDQPIYYKGYKQFLNPKGQKIRLRHFLILDDDRSLLQLPGAYAPYLVLTEYRAGFDEACLEKAMGIVEGWKAKT